MACDLLRVGIDLTVDSLVVGSRVRAERGTQQSARILRECGVGTEHFALQPVSDRRSPVASFATLSLK